MTEQDVQIQVLREALQAASHYIERLEAVQQRRKVRDMTEAMEHYHRVGPPLLSAIERENDPFAYLGRKK